ncbi:MAG: SLBB domain-containing protein [Clostridia bacterium]|nr:SLBB domain-containing protein [Clostridia bacterium]
MKRFFALILILICFVTLLSACGNSFAQKTPIQGDGFNKPTASPYQSQTLPSATPTTYRVYICGAVQNEGYYNVVQGTTIGDAIALAGILPQTVLPTNLQVYVQSNMQIVVEYLCDDAHHVGINVNGAYVISNTPAPNIPADVMEKLHNYYIQNGVITNKQILKQILTEEQYQQNHYKFFVAEEDYAKAN